MDKVIEFRTADEQLALFGPQDRNLRRIRDYYGVKAIARSGKLKLEGNDDDVLDAYVVMLRLMEHIRRGGIVDDVQVENVLMHASPPDDRFGGPRESHRGAHDSGRFPVVSAHRNHDASMPTSSAGRRQSGRRSGANGGAHGQGPSSHDRDRDRGPRRTSSAPNLLPMPLPPPADEVERRSGRPRTLRPEEVLAGDVNLAQALSPGQVAYIQAMKAYDVVFAIGPAGSGKTFLATAMAVDCLNRGIVRKIVLVRPAVEAGEKLGYLPGDFQAKINPYLRPIFDALGTLLDYNVLRRYMERDIIEIAPLAYMRGRTLEHAFIILDEAQNTTPRQMMMFLTRFGRFSKVVVTGDVTQIDLAYNEHSGLVDADRVLSHVPGIGFVNLTEQDIVRHELVQRIVGAYEGAEKRARIPLFRNRNAAPPRHHPNRFDETESGPAIGEQGEMNGGDAAAEPAPPDTRASGDAGERAAANGEGDY